MNIFVSTDAWFSTGGWPWASFGALVALLIGAAWIDIREHRIPNSLVFSGAVLALLMAHLPGGTVSGSLLGIAIGMAMGLPLYWLRAMGAGDVKLLGMVGAFLGADVFAATLVIFVVGGVFGLVAVARRRAFAQLGVNLKQMLFGILASSMAGESPAVDAPARSVGVQPYGVAIAAGTILYLAVVKGGIFA